MQTVIHGSSPIIKVSIKLVCIKSMPQKDGFIFNQFPHLGYVIGAQLCSILLFANTA